MNYISYRRTWPETPITRDSHRDTSVAQYRKQYKALYYVKHCSTNTGRCRIGLHKRCSIFRPLVVLDDDAVIVVEHFKILPEFLGCHPRRCQFLPSSPCRKQRVYRTPDKEIVSKQIKWIKGGGGLQRGPFAKFQTIHFRSLFPMWIWFGHGALPAYKPYG